jgi:uncharacterized protein
LVFLDLLPQIDCVGRHNVPAEHSIAWERGRYPAKITVFIRSEGNYMLLRWTQICETALALILLAFLGCSGPREPGSGQPQSQDPVLRERVEKDTVFRSDNSPILLQERANFKGLSYYPIDPGLKFSVQLHRYPVPAQVRMATNTGEIRSGLRYGFFDFQVGGQDCRLQVYRLEDAPGDRAANLFIPFRDSTSGRETYAAGRYIDLKENTSGTYSLDFNRAYNPSCAYNSEFSCPVPPAENTLKVPIRAGEKRYH